MHPFVFTSVIPLSATRLLLLRLPAISIFPAPSLTLLLLRPRGGLKKGFSIRSAADAESVEVTGRLGSGKKKTGEGKPQRREIEPPTLNLASFFPIKSCKIVCFLLFQVL